MALPLYLAMTAAEMGNATSLPGLVGYMACHFSPYGQGLSSCPKALPENSILIVDDITPISPFHNPQVICRQLQMLAERFGLKGIVLDFQREKMPKTQELVKAVYRTLQLPVVVSHRYGECTDGPVLLPPCPADMPLQEHLAPWKGRQIWLEAALEGLQLRLTEDGCSILSAPSTDTPLHDEALCCHYRVETGKDYALFSLRRTRQDLDALLEKAESLGVTAAIGLYQELG